MHLKPITFKEACAFIDLHHRHHRPPQGHKFSIGLIEDDKLVGVACVGRPVARGMDDGYTAEVTRLCTTGTGNACSMLYGACWRAAKAMGYTRCITYILDSEPGTSLKAVGWLKTATTDAKSWNTAKRVRVDKHPVVPKQRYEIASLSLA